MQKVSNKFKPSGCNYKYHFKTYYDQPKGTVIKYYLRDENNSYTAVCRHKWYLRELLLICVLAFCVYTLANEQHYSAQIFIPKYLTLTDDILSLDLLSNKESDVECRYSVMLKEETLISGILMPGQSIGNVKIDKVLANGDYQVQLIFQLVDGTERTDTVKKDLLLQVRTPANESSE